MPVDLLAFLVHGCILAALAYPTARSRGMLLPALFCLLVLGLIFYKGKVSVLISVIVLIPLDICFASYLVRNLRDTSSGLRGRRMGPP